MLAAALVLAGPTSVFVSAQGSSLDEAMVPRVAQAIQDVVQSKVKLLPVEAAMGFAKNATWGITALRDPAPALGLNDMAVLALVDVKQNIYVNNILVTPGSYYLVKFQIGPNRTEAQLEKDPSNVRVIFVLIPPAGANVDLAQQVRSSATRISAATVARKLAQSAGFNLIRSEGILAKAPASGEFTLGMTFGALAACWAISPRTMPSVRSAVTNQAPTLAMRPTTPQGFAAIDDVITIDATASRDPDGQIRATAWDFGDDTSSTTGHVLTSPIALKTAHRYEHVGKYSLQFRAMDDQCGYSQLAQSIEIRPWLAVAITLNPDFSQVPAKGPIGLRTDIFNNSLSRRFEGQTTIDVDENPLFGPAPVQLDLQQGLSGVPASFEFPQPLGLGRHRLSVILKDAKGIERGRDDASFEVPVVAVALNAVGETNVKPTAQIHFDTILQNNTRDDFKGTIELFLTRPDRTKKSLAPTQPVSLAGGQQLTLPAIFSAAGLPLGNLIFTVELRSSATGAKIDQASIYYTIKK